MKARVLVPGILTVSILGSAILAAPPENSSPSWIQAIDRSMDSLAVLNAVSKDRFHVDPALRELEGAGTGEFRLHQYFMQMPLRVPIILHGVGNDLVGAIGLESRLALLDRLARPNEVSHPAPSNPDPGESTSLTAAMKRVYEGTGKRFQGKDRNQFSLQIRNLPVGLHKLLSRLMLAVLDAYKTRNAVLKTSDFGQGGAFNAKSRKTAERLREFLFGRDPETDRLGTEAAEVLAALESIRLSAVTDGGIALARAVDALIEPLKQAAAGDGSDAAFQFEWNTPRGRFAVGGSGSNEYKGHYTLILDLGGSDRYQGSGSVSGMDPVSLIVDLGGEDHYESADSAWAAPGGAILGYAGIVDLGHARDEYLGTAWGGGFGFLGVGWIFDEGGNDTYEMQWLAQGAGIFGIGLLLDQGGDDIYRLGQRDSTLETGLGQGFGGPSGIGVHLDLAGNDVYSCFGEPDSGNGFGSLFQGAAVGSFWDLPGGLGILVDGAGDDTYLGSSSTQGSGADYGIGVLIELGGNDFYTAGNRSQGYGTRTGLGVLMDVAGGDGYDCSEGRHCLGVGENLGMGMFLDVTGSDRYKAGMGSMGVSISQGAGWFLEVSGNDKYAVGENSIAFTVDSPVDPWRVGVPGVAVFLDLEQRSPMPGGRRAEPGSAYFLPRGEVPGLGGGTLGVTSSHPEPGGP